ncbi:hypothetical protein TREMEDRAFT_65137 [Tremella mesenterica DSM 1558]|uniref:uncharacterized protein n=1 Tax=Tremella mesenterica (strain ATCC 24925 / CBS 8224 / DSM 1558 / NBRC 9311 / NRRL Y-6157 / RJB 2259-6 / UBC 559-6) TaxID=578456 RepID=UPI00032CC45B|nr:uncharacterized protein TREMEDRAFT_65137 [Tremella mesenterica DSM 1558]EIW66738.1 hypothetical protein TREMEDRAFT_65137 [Tremella mesenterica DSM 1558]
MSQANYYVKTVFEEPLEPIEIDGITHWISEPAQQSFQRQQTAPTFLGTTTTERQYWLSNNPSKIYQPGWEATYSSQVQTSDYDNQETGSYNEREQSTFEGRKDLTKTTTQTITKKSKRRVKRGTKDDRRSKKEETVVEVTEMNEED